MSSEGLKSNLEVFRLLLVEAVLASIEGLLKKIKNTDVIMVRAIAHLSKERIYADFVGSRSANKLAWA